MKILIVDDSIVFRSGISQALKKVPEIEVFKAVSNGKVAIDFLKKEKDIDLITLDMEMPVMNGLEAIKEIRKFNKKVIIIVFSAMTVRGAEITIESLTHGANDFVAKVEGGESIEESINMIRDQLLPKIKAFSIQRGEPEKGVESSYQVRDRVSISHEPNSELVDFNQAFDLIDEKPRMILIGSSTGGPDALSYIFSKIKEQLNVPIFIVQHMPPIFTTKLAEHLNRVSSINVKEGAHGEIAKPGFCYIAPGNYHMTLENDKGQIRIQLSKGEKVCFVRPSVDVLFKSCALNFNGPFLSIVLTGMGRDGTNGAKALINKKCYLFVQDKESSAVWGMAGSIDAENIGSRALNLIDIAMLINKFKG
ncbi:MAG: chemotaxis-specific protein-glutamate methyltransferase CheB [Bacteriovoracaceae bacterium]